MLKNGAVRVNDQLIKDAKEHVDPESDDITVYGEPVVYQEFIYLMMNKPQGVLSATEDSRQETVVDLLDPELLRFEPFPVGRLDKDTEGLLLLTNDGQLAHQLLSPKNTCLKRMKYMSISRLIRRLSISLKKGSISVKDMSQNRLKCRFWQTKTAWNVCF